MYVGDWVTQWVFDEHWDHCPEVLEEWERTPGHVGPAVCICYPGHEHPHLAMNKLAIVRGERIVSVSRRKSMAEV